MRVCILFGSLRTNSNTALLLEPFMEELKELGAEVDHIILRDKHIEPCTACWACQNIFEGPGCPKEDDMGEIYELVLKADCIIFATPIYSWYCTPPMKAVMDRLVYGMNKYYGETEGPCLWEGKRCGLVTTCGYEIEEGAGVFEEGLRRYSKHSNLDYIGKVGVRDRGKKYFRSRSAVEGARKFASRVFESLEEKYL
ncbi:FMN reductase [Propionigenium maris DSM 9537]|uniref:FMN reductase n=1 Tax=Propionigenium maris DSM 9537 TaxID=1123000 RepID=A0A9W6GPC9_9FUSO|nr:flavodoxin family protein [Propionigenium maris]GLI57895.1 FMN reductase [Propionigenium maris DSM 9537]